ncbi:hypothetical protein [Lentibacillus sp.]|uniref:hypothetical protein n=1 Tax=Lentibacillus sp. TaxID=1925746 RepID=UPI002B4B7DA2|nr:hypothetical protein [Lentibacillus sp.]HLS08658.1 hypothetical protein [Lentibacillus sp.]
MEGKTVYPVLMGSKSPASRLHEKLKKHIGRAAARKGPIRSGLHDAGNKGVATRRCEFSLCSFSSVHGKSTPLNEVSLYFLFTDTGTYLNRLINFVTKQSLNHVSIAFDPALTEVYSFGRKRPRNPFIGGFVKEDVRSDFLKGSNCAIYTYKLTETECRRVRERIAEIELRKQNYKYNFLGLFGLLLHVELNRDDALFCSQFVATVLSDVETVSFHKPACFVTPADIRNHKGMELIYRGRLENYQPEAAGRQIMSNEARRSVISILTEKVKRLVIR